MFSEGLLKRGQDELVLGGNAVVAEQGFLRDEPNMATMRSNGLTWSAGGGRGKGSAEGR